MANLSVFLTAILAKLNFLFKTSLSRAARNMKNRRYNYTLFSDNNPNPKIIHFMNSYSVPREINNIKDCYFYHTIDLPVVGTVRGNWDLRKHIKDYLGNVEFKDKRVLDVGCANGALSFYILRCFEWVHV
jgi:2-polyprenyl-3-methyl-5-hydroxy-6-metoxy-1,4-benzoquinol methylase